MDNILEALSISQHEQERLAKLHNYQLGKNYSKTGAFQHVVGMAAHIFNVPLAFVNIVDDDVVIAESIIGLNNISEFERHTTLCSHAVLRDEVTVFNNAKEDPCLATNPFVHGELGVQFYAAAPLKTPDGFKLGVVGIVDRKPRTFTKEDERVLEGLAAIVMEELEARLHSAKK